MKKAILLVVCMANFLLPGWVQAEADKSMMIYGAGSYSCGNWVEERKNSQSAGQSVFSQWVLGYVSAAGRFMNLRHGDSDSFLGWMDRWCKEHPHEGIVDAAAALVEDLQQRQINKGIRPTLPKGPSRGSR